MNLLDLKPGDAQVNWDAIKSKKPNEFIDEVNRQLYEENPDLNNDNAYTSNNGLELKDKKGGRKTRKHNKNKRILKKYKKINTRKVLKNKKQN
jgi:hypothetical protein